MEEERRRREQEEAERLRAAELAAERKAGRLRGRLDRQAAAARESNAQPIEAPRAGPRPARAP